MLRYKALPRFLLAHQSRYSHNYLNLVELQDEHIVEHFIKLLQTNVLNNSIIVTMADHGHRFEKIRQTHQGFFISYDLLAFLVPIVTLIIYRFIKPYNALFATGAANLIVFYKIAGGS